MTPEDWRQRRKALLDERRQQAYYVISHPGFFCVCEGCDCVLDATIGTRQGLSPFCPHCGGYRFCYDEKRVLEVAEHFLSRPLEQQLREEE